MPNIRSSADLRNSYNKISTFCHKFTHVKKYLAFYVVEENRMTVIRFLYAKSR